ncbi:hypothetical protein ACQ4M4_18430 [Leptolyngbya sp. AN02str]|uniref:hypothetical protein n=1 Tax=Leptolyngbya sp. AN02str TaxID=3423363 RepID=UPI003D322AE7
MGAPAAELAYTQLTAAELTAAELTNPEPGFRSAGNLAFGLKETVRERGVRRSPSPKPFQITKSSAKPGHSC